MIGLIGQSVLDRTQWPDGRVEERLGGAPVFAARAVADVWPAVVLTHGGAAELRQPLHELGLRIVEGPSSLTTVFEVTLYGDGTWSEEVTAIGDSDLITQMLVNLTENSLNHTPVGTAIEISLGLSRVARATVRDDGRTLLDLLRLRRPRQAAAKPRLDWRGRNDLRLRRHKQGSREGDRAVNWRAGCSHPAKLKRVAFRLKDAISCRSIAYCGASCST